MKNSQTLITDRTLTRSFALSLATLLFSSAAVQADEVAYTMTTIVDSAYGDEVIAGQYARAIEKITEEEDTDTFFHKTNLCVAYTKSGNLDDAADACNAAVTLADEMSYSRQSEYSKPAHTRLRKTYLAIAFSNRGVLRAVLGQADLAHQDFVEALTFNSRKKVLRENLERLGETESAEV